MNRPYLRFGHLALRAMVCLAFCLAFRPASSEEARTFKTDEDKLSLQIPKSWNEQPPANRMRLAQFGIPKAEGDKDAGELVVFPPFGGTRDENIKRWVAQFDAKDRQMKLREGKTAAAEYVLADISGTYKKPIGPPMLQKTEPTEGYRMLAVIYSPTPGGMYFLKLTGPEKTITAAADAFRASFGAKVEGEKEFVLPE